MESHGRNTANDPDRVAARELKQIRALNIRMLRELEIISYSLSKLVPQEERDTNE